MNKRSKVQVKNFSGISNSISKIRGKKLDIRVKMLNTMGMKYAGTEISKQLFHLMSRIIFLEKKNIFEYKDVKLFPSEIHILLFMQGKQPANATNMSNKLGISKSAVSQTISRLEKKGVIIKEKDPYNKNELILSFTPFGEEAFGRYKRKLVSNRNHFNRYVKALSENEREVIHHFLSEMEGVIDRLK
jgi:DNA-binding MarR family transcriptional regulator